MAWHCIMNFTHPEYYLFYMYGYFACMYLCGIGVLPDAHRDQKRGLDPMGACLQMVGCEPLCVCCESNLGSLEEELVLLINELLQPWISRYL